MESMFIIILILSIYSYFLYPLILKLLIPSRKICEDETHKKPHLSLIITAHNEEERIREKIENSLLIQYEDDLLEIIVASDCSSDKTDSIVVEYANKGIRLVVADARKGKEYAQFCAIKKAQGEILVFSDVATKVEPESFNNLVKYFNDPNVGALSSEDEFVSQDGKVVGEGAYVRYEMWLRRLESKKGGLVGLSGSFFAARKEICESWDISVPSDFNTALNCAKNGKFAVSCPDVVGIYQDVKNPELEYRRKNRTVIRGITALTQHPEVLNPLKLGLFSFQIWGHKIMRWAEPWFMSLLFIMSVYMFNSNWLIDTVFVLQIIFYSLVIIGYFSEKLRDYTIIKIPYFFVQVNIAIAHATIQFIFGKRITVWEPSKR